MGRGRGRGESNGFWLTFLSQNKVSLPCVSMCNLSAQFARAPMLCYTQYVSLQHTCACVAQLARVQFCRTKMFLFSVNMGEASVACVGWERSVGGLLRISAVCNPGRCSTKSTRQNKNLSQRTFCFMARTLVLCFRSRAAHGRVACEDLFRLGVLLPRRGA